MQGNFMLDFSVVISLFYAFSCSGFCVFVLLFDFPLVHTT